jgi:subtilisin family serine protease
MKLATVTRSFAKSILAAFLAVACTAEAEIHEQAPETSEPVLPIATHLATVEFDDDIVAMLEEPTKSAEIQSLLAGMGIEGLERVFPDAGEFEARSRAMGMHRFYDVVLRDNVPVTKAVESLETTPGIVSVSLPRPIRKRSYFNDPYSNRQWNLVNEKYPNADIHLAEVWEQYTVGRNSVIVAVVDECVDPTHPDLEANLWKDAQGNTGFNFARGSYDLRIRPEDGEGDIGHGTHVAGVISALNNNGEGVSSMAGGDAARGIPGVLIQSCAIFSGKLIADDSQSAAAIKWGADHGAVISQNSWGYNADANEDGKVTPEELDSYRKMTIPEVLRKAIDYFIRYAGCDKDGKQLEDSPMKGGLVVFAAGNEGRYDVDYDPICNYSPVISVGAFSVSGNRAAYSNFGSWVDIAAPGGGGANRNDCVWSTVPTALSTAGYEGVTSSGIMWVGTSMACPHVSGAAALIVSLFGQEGFTANMCKEILFAGLGETIGGTRPIGKKLDVLASVEYGIRHYPVAGSGANPQPPMIELEKEKVTLKAHETVSVGVTASDPDQDLVSLECTPGSAALVYDLKTRKAIITGKDAPAGTYKAVFTATDSRGLTAEASLEYTLLPNHPPVAQGTLPDIVILQNQTVTPSFSDEDGETLTLQAQSADPQILQASAKGSSVTLIPRGNGLTSVTVTALDGLGATATQRFRVAVRTTSNPMMVYPVPASTVVYFWPDSQVDQTLKVTLYSATGSRVLSAELTAGVFSPAELDITALAPGKYTAVWEYDGKSQKETVVKN